MINTISVVQTSGFHHIGISHVSAVHIQNYKSTDSGPTITGKSWSLDIA